MLKFVIYLKPDASEFKIYYSEESFNKLSKFGKYHEAYSKFPVLSQFKKASNPKQVLKALKSFQASKYKEIFHPDYQKLSNNHGSHTRYTGGHEAYQMQSECGDTLELTFLHQTGKEEAKYLALENMISLVKRKSTPILPFFRALNPASKFSGINNLYKENKEVLDRTVSEQIEKAFHTRFSFLGGLCATYDILVGNHWVIKMGEETVETDEYCGEGSKGLLDFFILPLISRKIRWDSLQANGFIQALALLFVVPVEALRMTTGIALTLLLSPVVFLVQLFSCCLGMELQEPDHDFCCGFYSGG